MMSTKQIEANRRNARKSTGPRTAEGKARSRLNALVHGLRAEELGVLPNEDPEAYRARLDAYLDDFRPRSSVEADLVRHAADISWRLDRVRRFERLALSGRVEEAMARGSRERRDRFEEMWRKLLPAAEQVRKGRSLPLESAAWLRRQVEATAEGCLRMLTAWRQLREVVEASATWSEEQELHAVRLVGHGPDFLVDPGVLDMIMANRMLKRTGNLSDFMLFGDGVLCVYFSRDPAREARERLPATATPAEAVAVLRGVVDREVARLEALLLDRRDERVTDDAEAAELAGALASFDDSDRGERLRRYQLSLHRELLRTIAAIAKLRRDESKWEREDEAGDEGDEIAGDVPSDAAPADPPEDDAPNEPIVQDMITFDVLRSPGTGAEKAPVPLSRPRPMTDRERAIARMAKKALKRR